MCTHPGFSETGAGDVEQQIWSGVKSANSSKTGSWTTPRTKPDASTSTDDELTRETDDGFSSAADSESIPESTQCPDHGSKVTPTSKFPEGTKEHASLKSEERSKPSRNPDGPNEDELVIGSTKGKHGESHEDAANGECSEVWNSLHDAPQQTSREHPWTTQPAASKNVKMMENDQNQPGKETNDILSPINDQNDNFQMIQDMIINISIYAVSNYLKQKEITNKNDKSKVESNNNNCNITKPNQTAEMTDFNNV